MKSSYRLILCALTAVVILASVWLMGPGTPTLPASDPGEGQRTVAGSAGQPDDEEADTLGLFDVVAVPRHMARLSQAQREQERLTARMEAVVRRIAGKERVVAALIAGRTTLLEAARQFRDLDKADPTGKGGRTLVPFADGADDERYCRTVIDYARGFLRSRPEALVAAVVGRLEAEFRAQVNTSTFRTGRGPVAE